MKNNVMSAALAAAVASSVGNAGDYKVGEYQAGDFHNHTTCSDGSTSVKTLTRQSLSYLDWFIHVGHSGSGSRNCNISDFLYLNRDSEFNRGLWVNSLENGADDIKGDESLETMFNGSEVRAMWRWQSLQEFNLGGIVEERELPGNEDKTAFLGLEWVVPGHEHSSNSISAGNFADEPNADALAQFEYCFARNSDDSSQGGGQGWTCEINGESNARLIELFKGRPEEGVADYNSTLVNGINIEDDGQHVKSAAAMLWMQENYPEESFAVQAHVERQGAFIPEEDEGYNVEHMRDWNTLAPKIAFGFETQPGHQAALDRGTYSAGRPSSGLYTFGGTGCYGAAEASKPGEDFDGKPLDPEEFLEGSKYPDIDDDQDPAKVTLCRPGVRTMWDALLSEGRHFWFFASSDWHNRGMFGPLDFESTLDFWPGEYQENFAWVRKIGKDDDPAKAVVQALRSGNSYTVQGQLVKDLKFVACTPYDHCATMGQTLEVKRGTPISVHVEVTDPDDVNNSRYKFDNPSLLQIGMNVPINQPKLMQVDLIGGRVTRHIPPSHPDYFNPLAPSTTHIVKTWTTHDWGKSPTKEMDYAFHANQNSYIRARGSNIPAGTPNERDADGNPLPDNLTDNIPCEDAECPAHIEGVLDADVEAWADVWFHTNPIFIKIN